MVSTHDVERPVGSLAHDNHRVTPNMQWDFDEFARICCLFTHGHDIGKSTILATNQDAELSNAICWPFMPTDRCSHRVGTSFADLILQDLCSTHPLPYPPKLVWRKLRVTAGTANPRTGTITLSEIVLKTPEQIRATVIHEYAHLLTVARHGRQVAKHGTEWKQVMRELGEEPVVRHSYEVVRNMRRQVVIYECRSCGQQITRSRRLPKSRKYVHAGCGGDLLLVRIERSPSL